jgi:dihydrofolate reductase
VAQHGDLHRIRVWRRCALGEQSTMDAADAQFATWINISPKYVASTTLDNVDDWPNSTLITGDLAAAVHRLKAGQGKAIAVAGSPVLVRSLLDQNLLDELVLLIHPVLAGEGRKKLFADATAIRRSSRVDQ